jgi:hypothetical protein
MFHLGNIIQLARDVKSEVNLKRLDIWESWSASFIKKHVARAEIIAPAIKEVIKEEKNQGFKRQNYSYSNRNYYGRRKSFSIMLIHKLIS